ncbi:archaeal heat shock protein Hsp20 [Candidatus Nitrosocosmicus hydrocola]|uniref:archaeal heat shock protein Hsp20 n=1 Tax=Candidatus Nitrosocosmicus hydrocola TaxID=1826872 RepID=UPI0011E59658|nr:archaeal heat shock protein Hsp20 [Candidatus Nitrosocosmicus hydrocola]
MSNNITPFDWINRFFDQGNNNRFGRLFGAENLVSEIESIHKEMDSIFEVFNENTKQNSKELVREYETEDGRKVRQVGPIVYGYSMTIGPDGKPHVTEFGNVKSLGNFDSNKKNIPAKQLGKTSTLSAEREPLVDVNTTEKEVKVVVEMPGVRKEDIKVNAANSQVEIDASYNSRKYHKLIELPKEADIETAKSIYNNGVLEITFNKKKEDIKPKGKEIKIE